MTPTYSQLLDHVGVVRRSWRIRRATEGALLTLAIGVVVLLVLVLCDRWGRFGHAGRGVLALLFWGGLAAAGWYCVLRRRRAGHSQDFFAALIERALPVSGGRFISALQLGRDGAPDSPRLVEAICGVNGRVLWRGRRQVVRRVLRPRTAAETWKVLQQVVEHEGGTGKACRLDYWTSFGKTGTAQIPGRGGYVDGAYAGTFVGGAPASMPRAVCLITIYWPDKRKGYYGSKVAAPQVKKVLHKTLVYLEVPPDKDDARMARGRRSPRGDLAVRRRSAAGSRGAAAAPAGNASAAADSF